MVTIVRNSDTGKPCTPFMSYASGAALAEQRGDFQKAAEVWSKALVFARNAINRQWAGSRIEFCANAVHRGWGVPGESETV